MNKLNFFRNRRFPLPLIHILFWGIFFSFPLFFSQQENESLSWLRFLNHLIVPFMLCATFYINYLGLIPSLLLKNKHISFFISNTLLIIFCTILIQLLFNELRVLMPPPSHLIHKPAPPARIMFVLRDIISLSFCVGISISISMSMQFKAAEKAREEAERNHIEAELKNLRNQLNPHFLLNTLNNIYALIAFDTEKAQKAIEELSKLLRYLLYENLNPTVSLIRELDFINNYIELMRIRYSTNVEIKTDFEVHQDSRLQITPLIFISLIENAFKHGISSTAPSYIHISIKEETNCLICYIANSYFPKSNSDKSGSGIGLEQVRRRLELSYPDQYEWIQSLDEDTNTFITSLIIYKQSPRLKI